MNNINIKFNFDHTQEYDRMIGLLDDLVEENKLVPEVKKITCPICEQETEDFEYTMLEDGEWAHVCAEPCDPPKPFELEKDNIWDQEEIKKIFDLIEDTPPPLYYKKPDHYYWDDRTREYTPPRWDQYHNGITTDKIRVMGTSDHHISS